MIKRHKCPCCGKDFWGFTMTADGSAYDKAWKGPLCKDCDGWMRQINADNGNREVIAGVCYDFLPPQTDIGPGDLLGGGRMKYILKKDGSVKKSNDIWEIGAVPLHLRGLLPDTGWWISRRLFRRLGARTFECRSKGCFDRYHCLRYDIRQEYGSGPFNTIPKSWIVGDEKCPSFCNILEIEHYDGFVSIDD